VTLLVRLLLLLAVLAGAAAPAAAHEVRPALLELDEAADGTVAITWKQPIVGDLAVPLRPSLSSGWLARLPASEAASASALVRHWRIAAPHAPLAGQTVRITGLDATMTDVLINVHFAGGERTSQLIGARDPSFRIPAAKELRVPVARYLWLGMTHIWGGLDHLFYVAALILLVGRLRPLLLTLTSFTLAHSITLALTTLGLVELPQAPVELLIALSIVYLAVELIRRQRGEAGWAARRPWLVAFPFGLLHGFGFAGALREVGLPAGDVPMVLLLFNIGIEIGQVAFVLTVVATAKGLALASTHWGGLLTRWSPYALGSVASYWFFLRMAQA